MMGHRNFRAMKKLLGMDVPDILQALTEDPSILTYFSVLLSEAERTTNAQPAAGPWRTDPPPKDGERILAFFRGNLRLVHWKEGRWYGNFYKDLYGEPTKWAEIFIPEKESRSDDKEGSDAD